MDNVSAMAVLDAQERAIGEAKRRLTRYIEEVSAGRWTSATVRSQERTRIKDLANQGGIDLSTWDGKAAPPASPV